jgi:hypothetical protein
MDWTQLIGSVGFPIALSVYLIITMNKTLGEVRDTLLKLTALIENLNKKF